ncbi:putative phosphohydrolase [Polaromonas phage Tiera]|nr:putative phosphohydrolase [Polaromonas phage Tiera]
MTLNDHMMNPAFGNILIAPESVVMIQKPEETYKPPLVIYHGNCADGFSAAWVFWQHAMKEDLKYEFHAGVYGKHDYPDVTGKIVYLVDFSYSLEEVQKMLKKARMVILIDHHKTAIESLSILGNPSAKLYDKRFKMYTDLERSGAMLAWDFLYNIEYDWETIPVTSAAYIHPPRLLEHVQDRDLWKFKLPQTRDVSANLFSYGYTFENWDRLMKMNVTDTLHFSSAGAAIERKHFKDIKELLKLCKRPMNIGGYLVPVASIPYTMSSDAGAIMAGEFEDGTKFAACYIDTAMERIFSLRSVQGAGLDVSLIAKEYGGGGHKHAAGFKVPRDHILARN